MSGTAHPTRVEAAALAGEVAGRLSGGGRFAGLVGSACGDGSTLLRAIVARNGTLDLIESSVPPDRPAYPALTPLVPAAAWYEREIHDLFGVEPCGHPRLDPLVLPLAPGVAKPRPGAPAGGGLGGEAGQAAAAAAWAAGAGPVELDTAPLPGHVSGEGVFTIPYGPVRSGVFESIEYLVETPGEEIPHLRTRVYHKHRGLDQRFGDFGADDAVLLAERVEGTCSVAHAIAFSEAVEALAGLEPPRPAQLVRVVHAELERVAVHLDSIVRHTEGSGQAVAYARLSRHKEEVLRLRGRLCGHRFGRGVVVPGGVSGGLLVEPGAALGEVGRLHRAIRDDVRALMATPSFLDRLRGTGVLPACLVASHGALGPVARGSGIVEDVRAERPYSAYRFLGSEPAAGFGEGDALARQRVRVFEIHQAFHLIRQALDELAEAHTGAQAGASGGEWRAAMPPVSGLAVSSVEAPQGELLYVVEADRGRLVRVKARCASFHNLVLLPEAFRGDIFTDFVFIEASFGLSTAGVAG